jgi:DNA polymerase III alpha subunit (gram-positive type)
MKKILVVDIETTGLKPETDFILEVGIVELDLETGDIEILYDAMVRENGMTDAHLKNSWLVKNGYMTEAEYQRAISFDVAKGKIQTIIDNEIYSGATAYNKVFDFGFFKRAGIVVKNELSCPMILSTDVCKIPNQYRAEQYKWPKVEEAWAFFFPDKPYKELHRGADDAFHEAQIVFELYKRDLFKV